MSVRSSHGFVRRLAGRSSLGRAITVHIRAGRSHRTIMVLGGIHGDEPKSVFLTNSLIELLSTSPKSAGRVTWIIVPLVNPDGFERRKRRNARGVDLNRNFPTRNWQAGPARSRMYGGPAPASELETRAVMRIVKRFRPDVIITIHSINRHRQCNNYDGPAGAIASAMSRHNRYPVTANIGYPTSGSFGTWAGVERGIPVVTLELPSHHSPQRCWLDNSDALIRLG